MRAAAALVLLASGCTAAAVPSSAPPATPAPPARQAVPFGPGFGLDQCRALGGALVQDRVGGLALCDLPAGVPVPSGGAT
ncbi:MAG: Protein of unknown function (DUF3558) [Rhodobacteraceae bacterium HLUCCA08]|nr:MAG: Protein of unknown function (DUF3558) [Rhodobacteraceae bacterium HLUCCA08]